jgi:arylsulfatase A-like enzyme
VVEEQVANVDIWPTLLDLLGLPALTGADGRSLLPLVARAAGLAAEVPEELASRAVFSQLDRSWGSPGVPSDPLVAVTQGGLRLFLPALQPKAARLFDRAADPGERKNVIADRSEDADRLRKLADAYLADAQSPWGGKPSEVELDELRLNQLRALGYVIK